MNFRLVAFSVGDPSPVLMAWLPAILEGHDKTDKVYPWNLDVSCVEPAEKLFFCLQKICFFCLCWLLESAPRLHSPSDFVPAHWFMLSISPFVPF